MTKIINKIVGIAILVLALAFTINITSYAGNIGWNGSATSPGCSIYTGNSTKNTDSSVIFMNNSSSSSSIGVIVQVRKYNSNDSFVNAEYPGTNYVISNNGVYYSILNTAYETYNSKCTVRLRLVTSAAGSFSGKWRADS